MGFLLLPKTAERSRILGTEWLGDANCVSVFVFFGRHLFLHRLSGVFEPRRRFTLTGGEFFAESQRGDSPSADGGSVPRPAAGQEGRHQGFYPLNSHFLLFLSLAQIAYMRPLRNRERQSGYRSVSFVKYSQFTDSVLLHRPESLRRRGIAVPRNS